jgi:hypothetical protein
MIAVIVGDEEMRCGPIPLALAHAGFEPHDASSGDEADAQVEARAGGAGCVLILDSGSLDRPANGGTWRRFLADHDRLPAVVVARGPLPEPGALAGEPHRIVVESPFDAAAVVAAARCASERRRAPARGVASRLFVEAG